MPNDYSKVVRIRSSTVLSQAKGYPDLKTRLFLSVLCKRIPNLPIYGMFDADPHGRFYFLHNKPLYYFRSQCLLYLQIRYQSKLSYAMEEPLLCCFDSNQTTMISSLQDLENIVSSIIIHLI